MNEHSNADDYGSLGVGKSLKFNETSSNVPVKC